MATKQAPKHIPANSSELYEKFINYLMLDGKKTKARKILSDCMKHISKTASSDPEKVFKSAIDNVKPHSEVKAKRIGGAVYQVPYEVKQNRQISLAFRWIIGAARGKKGTNMSKRLATELIDASNEQGIAFKKKEDTHRMAKANKAFAHFSRY